MAMFGNGKREKRGFDWTAAALALLSPQAGFAYRDAKDERRARRDKSEQALMQELTLRSSLEQEGFPQHVVDGLMSDPRRVSELLTERYKTRQGGAEGITVGGIDPNTGQLRTQTSAGWHNGDYFGATDGAAVPQRLYQGEKVMPVPQGGYLGIYGGPQSGPMSGATPTNVAPPSPMGPKPGDVEDGFRFKGGNPADPSAWEPVSQGGARAAASSLRFP